MIGNTLSEIAENKAGIIKPGCIVVSAPQKQEVREILEQKARQFGCPIIYAEPEKAVVLEEDYRGMRFSYKDSENISIRLSGKYQLINAVTAWEAVHVPGLLKKRKRERSRRVFRYRMVRKVYMYFGVACISRRRSAQ